MKKLILIACSFVLLASLPIGLSFAQEEGAAAACDNNRSGKSKNVDHTCECPRAMMDCSKDDPEIEKPGAKCKTYCKPEKCDCQNSCTS